MSFPLRKAIFDFDPQAGNVIIANQSHGLHVTGSESTANRVQNNFIGSDPAGQALGNAGDGVRFEEMARRDPLRPQEVPTFLELTPECGRFLGDHLGAEGRRFIGAVERNAPDWFVTLRAPNVGEEHSTDSPRNSFSIFLGQCYALGKDGAAMMRCQDIPFCRVGDLYHLRKMTANLRCLGGLKW